MEKTNTKLRKHFTNNMILSHERNQLLNVWVHWLHFSPTILSVFATLDIFTTNLLAWKFVNFYPIRKVMLTSNQGGYNYHMWLFEQRWVEWGQMYKAAKIACLTCRWTQVKNNFPRYNHVWTWLNQGKESSQKAIQRGWVDKSGKNRGLTFTLQWKI